MQAGLAYVCFSCNQIMERAPHGVCSYCASERIVSVSALMHEPKTIERLNLEPVNGGRRPLAERL